MKDINMSKVLLITEKHNIDLVSKDSGQYVLEGIFAEFGVKNNNNRIYEEQDYLPHLEYLNQKIKSNNLVGELDHPEKFEVSLSKVSHIIENLTYNKDKRQITGRIRILDTDAGKNAKNLIDGGVKLSISSRSAGIVESNNKVKLRQIFTYDLVANPGFENAGLSRVNESYGMSVENDASINLYDFTDKVSSEFMKKFESEDKYIDKNNLNSNMEQFVTEEALNTYSQHITAEVEKINETVKDLTEKAENSTLNERVEKLVEFTNYIVDELTKEKEVNEELRNRVDKLVEYTDYLTESVNTENTKLQNYGDYLAENLKNSILFSEQIAESATENQDKTILYTNYLAESLKKSIEYAEYVANESQATEDKLSTLIVEGKVNESIVIEPADRKERLTKINESIEKLLGTIEKQQKDPNEFVNLLTEGEKRDFLSMSDTKKTKVSNILSQSNELNESLVRDTINTIAKEIEVPNYIQ